MYSHPEGQKSWKSRVQLGLFDSSLHKLEFLEFSLIAAEACTPHVIKDKKESSFQASAHHWCLELPHS